MALGIAVRPEQYHAAGLERLSEVKSMREKGNGESVIAAYLSGLSVECSLRAFIPPGQNPSNHDLLYLAASGVLKTARDLPRNRIDLPLSEIVALWQNRLRFFSEDLFRAFCRKRSLSVALGVPSGSTPAAVVCRQLFTLSERVVVECDQIWIRSGSKAI
jgi:hypothetical protein